MEQTPRPHPIIDDPAVVYLLGLIAALTCEVKALKRKLNQ